MELLWLSAECFVAFADVLLAIVDAVAWTRSRGNRHARREAHRQNEQPVARTFWTWIFLLLTPIVGFLTALIVWQLIAR